VIVVQVNHPPVAQVKDENTPSNHRLYLNWILFLSFLAIAVISFVLDKSLFAIGASIGAIVTVIVTILQRFDHPVENTIPTSPPKPLGRAPYRTYSCTPTRETADNFSKISAELQKSIGSLGVEVDWNKYEELTNEAAECALNNAFSDAVHLHCKSISHIVATLKADRDSLRASDSHVDLI
jgi:hypothetical protein